MTIHIVQNQPEMPQDTGNIMRTCAATGVKLHLIQPMGFTLDNKHIKRSGASYAAEAQCTVYNNWDEFAKANSEGNFHFVTTDAPKNYAEIDFSDKGQNHYLIIGAEGKARLDNMFRIPTLAPLNVSNLAAIIAYEALRQQGFMGG